MREIVPSKGTPVSRVATNPVVRGFAPDPSIIRVGEWFYLATSSFEWYPTIPIRRLPCDMLVPSS